MRGNSVANVVCIFGPDGGARRVYGEHELILAPGRLFSQLITSISLHVNLLSDTDMCMCVCVFKHIQLFFSSWRIVDETC